MSDPYLPKLNPPDILARLRNRINDLPLESEYLLDDAADEIERLQKLCADYSRQLHLAQPS